MGNKRLRIRVKYSTFSFLEIFVNNITVMVTIFVHLLMHANK